MADHPKPIDPSMLDAETAAAEDFYLHVNRTWLEANPVPPEYPAWGAFQEVNARNEELLHDLLVAAAADPGAPGSTTWQVGAYFAAGMDEARLEADGAAPIGPLLERIAALASVADLPAVLRDLQLIGVPAFHSLDVIPDFEDPDRYHLLLGQGGLGLPERGYYLRDDDRSVALRAAYARHIANQLGHLGEAAETAAEQAQRIVALETRLAQPSLSPEQQRDLKLTINRHSASELDALMPDFGLLAYVRSFGVDPAELNVDNPGFFGELATALATTPLETIRDYLRWHLLRTYANALSAAFEDEDFDFYARTLGGQQAPKERWKRILKAATGDIGEAVAQLYVEAAFPEAARERCERMVGELAAAMRRSIEGLTWMTDATRAAALQKLDAFGWKIGYPETWRDYSSLQLDPSSFAQNRMRAATFEARRQLDRLDAPVDKAEWAMPAHVVNAYYHPLLNEIVFPAGILQPPMFYADADDAVNFGGIGTIIGHEITHGFDDEGRQYDPGGKVRDWWTEVDAKAFDGLADRLVTQFEAYRVLDDEPLNGRLTLGENIADLGGVAIAFDALLHALDGERPVIDGLTPEQRFFLAYASVWRTNYTDAYLGLMTKVDVHSPAPFRINGPVSNFAPFAEAFGIEPGAPMARTPEERVRIW